jgi:hypothetical protein
MADPKNPEVKFSDQIRSRTFAPTAQLIIAWDGTQVICEAPGQGGAARDKIEGISFNDLPAGIQAALVELLSKAKAAKPAPTTTERLDPQVVREQRIAEARAAHISDWQKKFDNASEDEKQKMLERREQAELRRSQDIWRGIVSDHKDITLANKVIPAARRPRRIEVMANGVSVSYNPQKETNSKAPKKIGGKIPTSGSFDDAIEIDL